MKRTSKLFSVILVLALALSLAVPAFAAEPTTSIYIKENGLTSGSGYAAYKLLSATQDGTRFAYTVNPTYRAALQIAVATENEITEGKVNEISDATIIERIGAMSSDTDAIRAFVKKTYDNITQKVSKQDTADMVNSFTGMLIDQGNVQGTTAEGYEWIIPSVPQGYYLVAEYSLGTNSDASTDSFSLLMLDTAGDAAIYITSKEDEPTINKQVNEKNDTQQSNVWGEVADYDIGDEVEFKITGTVSNKFKQYTSAYSYVITDTLSKGLTLNKDSIKVLVDNKYAFDKVDKDGNPETPDEAVYEISFVTQEVQGTDVVVGFTVTFADLKGLTYDDIDQESHEELSSESKIVVTYTATLNDKAVVGGAGNTNTVKLTYSNDPYGTGTGETAPDTNTVFTYDLTIEKVNGSDNNKPLTGATFELYKAIYTPQVDDMGEPAGIKTEWELVKTLSVDDEGNPLSTFNFKGLDAGDYKLVESVVPDGFNKIADITFSIESDLTKLTDTGALNADSVSANNTEVVVESDNFGFFTATIQNFSGTELPETGGIGTTIFYICGGILVLAAVVLLVTKRRMSTAE